MGIEWNLFLFIYFPIFASVKSDRLRRRERKQKSKKKIIKLLTHVSWLLALAGDESTVRKTQIILKFLFIWRLICWHNFHPLSLTRNWINIFDNSCVFYHSAPHVDCGFCVRVSMPAASARWVCNDIYSHGVAVVFFCEILFVLCVH